jgi:hypothetical protein
MIQTAKQEIKNNLQKIKIPDHIRKDFFTGIRAPFTYKYSYTVEHIFDAQGPTANQERTPTRWEGEAVQIDLNAAYITAVKNRGLLSEATYKKFFSEATGADREKKAKNKRHQGHAGEVYKYSKDARLICIGTLAQDKTIISYKSGEISTKRREYNEQEANVFWTAAADVGKLMFAVLEHCRGFFFWVDAIFLPKDQAETARAIFREAGYNTHEKAVYLTQNGGSFESIELETGEIKKYLIPTGKTAATVEAINSDEFLTEIFQEYKEILQAADISDKGKEKARAAVVREIKARYNPESETNLLFIASEAEKIGLKLEDIIKIRQTIEEQHKDAIFGEVIEIVTLEKLRRIGERASNPPPVEEMPNGDIIERFFEEEYF